MMPFELGFIAGLRGVDPRLCPFEKLTAEWREWQRFRGFGCEYAFGIGRESTLTGTAPNGVTDREG
jgi:hypothetical protein